MQGGTPRVEILGAARPGSTVAEAAAAGLPLLSTVVVPPPLLPLPSPDNIVFTAARSLLAASYWAYKPHKIYTSISSGALLINNKHAPLNLGIVQNVKYSFVGSPLEISGGPHNIKPVRAEELFIASDRESVLVGANYGAPGRAPSGILCLAPPNRDLLKRVYADLQKMVMIISRMQPFYTVQTAYGHTGVLHGILDSDAYEIAFRMYEMLSKMMPCTLPIHVQPLPDPVLQWGVYAHGANAAGVLDNLMNVINTYAKRLDFVIGSTEAHDDAVPLPVPHPFLAPPLPDDTMFRGSYQGLDRLGGDGDLVWTDIGLEESLEPLVSLA